MTSQQSAQKTIALIGLPYLMGRRAPGEGYQMARGPEVLLQDDSLAAHLTQLGFDVERNLLEGLDDATEENTGGDYRLLPKGDQMSRVLVQGSALARAVTAALRGGKFPLIAGGTCSSGIGAVAGVMGALDADPSVGMIWFDGHADANTPDTSRNGFIEGMPVTTIAGDCWPLWRAQYPGFSEIPYDRFFTVGNHEMYQATGRKPVAPPPGHFVDPPVIEKLGFEAAIDAELDRVHGNGVRKLYIHIDPDLIDPSEFESNSHVSPGGLHVAQLLWAIERAAARFEIVAVNLTAWDPDHDPSSREPIEHILVSTTQLALRA